MADSNLKNEVIVQATRIDATSLPKGFSQAFSQYLISQGTDFGNVAGKANEAGKGAYEAQVKNEDQDIELADHERRITSNEGVLANHEFRIQTAENNISLLDGRLTVAESDIDYLTDEVISIQSEQADHESRISQNKSDILSLQGRADADELAIESLMGDYVSKTATASQSLASPLDVTTSYSVGGVKVIGARVTGFTAATGTALKGAFNANASFTTSATYTQTEAQAMATALVATRQRLKALEDVMRAHGLIN